MLIGDSLNNTKPILTRAENEKKLTEDIDHLYFIGIGILMTAVSNPGIATAAAVAGVIVRQVYRDWQTRRAV